MNNMRSLLSPAHCHDRRCLPDAWRQPEKFRFTTDGQRQDDQPLAAAPQAEIIQIEIVLRSEGLNPAAGVADPQTIAALRAFETASSQSDRGTRTPPPSTNYRKPALNSAAALEQCSSNRQRISIA
jgi:hypothetical protein